MNSPNRLESRLAFIALFCALSLFFTPFEQAGPNPSMLPKYLVAGGSLFLLLPFAAIRPIRFDPPALHVLVVLALILVHVTAIEPVPGQFVLLIFADIFAAILLYQASFHWRREFRTAIEWLLWINAAFIIVQAGLFYVAGTGILDFHKMVFGSESRFSEDYLNIARFAGLQDEPGTYANYMGCLLAILLLTSDFSQRLLLLACVSLLGILFTNSGSSMYFAPLLVVLALYLWRKQIRAWHLVALAAALAAYLLASGIVTHLEERFFQREDGSLSHRIEGVAAYKATTPEQKFVGIGFGEDPCVRCFYQDIGVLFNLTTRGGAAMLLVLLGVLVRMIRANGLVLAILLALLPLNEKMFFYEPALWLFVAFAMTGLPSSAPARGARQGKRRRLGGWRGTPAVPQQAEGGR